MSASAIIDEVLLYLTRQNEFRDISFTHAFPYKAKPIPITAPIVSLGTEKFIFRSRSLGNVSHAGTAKEAVLKLKMDIHVPYKSGGRECGDIFCRICENLIMKSGFPISEISSSDVSASRSTDSFVMTAEIVINALLCDEEAIV